MNPKLKLLVKVELERLLQAGFIKPVEIVDWVSPIVLVKKKNWKLKVCMNYKKLNTCTQNYHFLLFFITLLLEEVGDHKRWIHRLQTDSHSVRVFTQDCVHYTLRDF